MPITYNQTGVTYDATGYTYDGETFQPTVFPIAGVYISFTDGPYTAAPAWTEVTTYVRSITTHRGRSSDLDQFDTGTAQIVLDNRDRRFDPFYTSGPYYPNGLTPRRQIRIVGQIGGQTYEVFRGFVAGWPVTWSEAGKDSTVTIQCFDALGLMANEVVPTDWPDYYTRPTAPLAYWKLNDTRATNTSLEQMGNYVWTFSGGSQAAVFREGQPASPTTIGGSTYFNDYIAGPPWGDTANIPSSITSNPPPAFTFAGFGWNPSGDTWIINAKWTRGIEVSISSAGVLTVDAAVAAGGMLQTTFLRFNAGALRFNPGIPTHFVVVASTTVGPNWDTLTVYINGKQISGTTSTTVGGSLFLYQTFMRFQVGTFQEVAIWTRALTATEAQNLGGAAVASLSETTSARMTRLLDTTDWPAALESFPASPVGTVAEIGSGTGVVPELQLVADSEGGELYVSKSGVLTMTARRDVFNATRSAVSQATFTDSGVGIRYGTELNIEYDADNLKNDITVNYSGDGEVNLYSDAVITGYGAAATTIETQLDSPTSALDLATLELGVEGVLVPQISPIDVSPNTVAADWQTILGLELLDRVTFKRTPTVGNQFDRAALVNAIDHQIEPGVWRTQLTLSMRYTSPLICDDPVRGRVDYNYCG